MSDTTGTRRGLTLGDAAREFWRHPSPWLLGAAVLWYRKAGRQGMGRSAIMAMGMACPNSGYVGYPVLLLTLIGTCISFTFINPFSHQSNLMVMGPGGYSAATFVRFGIPLIAVSMLTAFGVGWLLMAR